MKRRCTSPWSHSTAERKLPASAPKRTKKRSTRPASQERRAKSEKEETKAEEFRPRRMMTASVRRALSRPYLTSESSAEETDSDSCDDVKDNGADKVGSVNKVDLRYAAEERRAGRGITLGRARGRNGHGPSNRREPSAEATTEESSDDVEYDVADESSDEVEDDVAYESSDEVEDDVADAAEALRILTEEPEDQGSEDENDNGELNL